MNSIFEKVARMNKKTVLSVTLIVTSSIVVILSFGYVVDSAGCGGVDTQNEDYADEILTAINDCEGEACLKTPIKSMQLLPTIYDVKLYGAKGDGVTDDWLAIQTVLDLVASKKNGGIAYFKNGEYYINGTLLIGDNTTILGQSQRKTVFFRGNKQDMVPDWKMNGNSTDPNDKFPNCQKTEAQGSYVSKVLFRNRHYGCGEQNIRLQNFTINGGKLLKVDKNNKEVYTLDGKLNYVQYKASLGNMVVAGFSGGQNIVFKSITIFNAPQDAIFISNGGVGTRIENCHIRNHNRLWYNGGGINVEMHYYGNLATTKETPALILNNTITNNTQNYCRGHRTAHCSTDDECKDHPYPIIYDTDSAEKRLEKDDSDIYCSANPGECFPGICGVSPNLLSNATGISLRYNANEPNMPADDKPRICYAKVSGNTVYATDRNTGITLHGCQESIIEKNTIKSIESGTAWSGLYAGITVTEGKNIYVNNNTVIGSGNINDHYGIELSGSTGIFAKGNKVKNKNTSVPGTTGMGVVQIYNCDLFTFNNNVINNITDSVALAVGLDKVCTKNGEVMNNKLTTNGTVPLTIRNIANVVGVNEGVDLYMNTLSPQKVGDYTPSCNACNPPATCQ